MKKQLIRFASLASTTTIACVLFGFVALSGCSLFHEDYPTTECSTNVDCFRAQGEVCDMATNQCVVMPTVDAAATPDTGPMADADTTDADTTDADTTDADTTPDATAPDAT